MTIKAAYAHAIKSQKLVSDAEQKRVVEKLEKLQQNLLAHRRLSVRIKKSLRLGSDHSVPQGIYLWGGVGRGKTLLMDLFIDSLEIKTKKRLHFHRMMSYVHRQLKSVRGAEDPIDKVAARIAKETSLLCFDEFYVSDIGDAMMLGKLLDGLFSRGITLIATSNSHPTDLYKDGLQRQKFLPAIESLQAHTEVIKLDAGIDYRLRLFEEAGTYFLSTDGRVDQKLLHYFGEIASGDVLEKQRIQILGREIQSVY
ncbi:uncharacterized protein METZ01_LOCUS335075, partial [marine metagenome]